MDKTSLGDRMKEYENITRHKLMKCTPVVLRLDGKAFHTYTKGCDKPYDEDLHYLRVNTLDYLCNNIQGCILGYSQYDEISLVLKDWQTLQTSPWFDNNIQKMVSVTASMCTAAWNSLVAKDLFGNENDDLIGKFRGEYALFDCRAFNLPKEEVVNYLIWRQRDWERKSVQMLGQSLYSHRQLQGISNKGLITKIENEHGIVYGDLPDYEKRGEFWIKDKNLGFGEIINTPLFGKHRSIIEGILNNATCD